MFSEICQPGDFRRPREAVTVDSAPFRSDKKQSAHGDAAFMTECELREISRPDDLFPGVTAKGRRVRRGLETSILMFADRGGGKTQTANANIKGLKEVAVKPDLIIVDDHGDIEIACSVLTWFGGHGCICRKRDGARA